MSEHIYGAGGGPSNGQQMGTVLIIGHGGGGGPIHQTEPPLTIGQRIFMTSIFLIVAGGIAWSIWAAGTWLAHLDAEKLKAAKIDCVARGGKVIENNGVARFSCDGPTKF